MQHKKPVDASATSAGKNSLFPVFLKLEELDVLLVGAGAVGLEKLSAILRNAPNTAVTVVAAQVSPAVYELAARHPQVSLHARSFEPGDLEGRDIAVVATGDESLGNYIRVLARQKKVLVNVSDKPALCDFYLGSVVEKGNLKIAISTNGKSPTVAKRLREQFHEMIPDEIEGLLQNMHTLREDLKGDFAAKVRQLDDLTKVLVAKRSDLGQVKTARGRRWTRIVAWCVLALAFMVLGHALLSWIPYASVVAGLREVPKYIDTNAFLVMLATGFAAQMVDGSMGMGYGTISTTFLLAYGVSPAIVSSRVHAARAFSSGVSGYTHHRFGNINKRLFRALVIPGVLGAVAGAALAYIGQDYAVYVRLPLCLYTIYLGYYIVRKAFRRNVGRQRVKRAGWLASVGGFLDAFAGGGWGSLVTGTLISKRRNPRYVIGSVCLAEFFVVFASSITFFLLLRPNANFFLDIAGLIVGGLIAAPIAARLVGKIPLKSMFIAVGGIVIVTSLMTLAKVLGALLK